MDLHFYCRLFGGFQMSRAASHSTYRARYGSGTIWSYVIGFLLSLVFTLLPYYLVVNNIFAGTNLLLIILGFGVGQMIIQIIFFLHLGRGPKPNWNLFFFASTVVVILIVVGGSIMIINNLHYNMSPSDQLKKLINDEGIAQIDTIKTGACVGPRPNHQVTIIKGKVEPLHTTAAKCDTLTFSTADSVVRDIAFGPHQQHQVYAGVTELIVEKGQSQTMTLSDVGTYHFHDHLNPQVAGDFTVKP